MRAVQRRCDELHSLNTLSQLPCQILVIGAHAVAPLHGVHDKEYT
jgi:hypothetical protein